MLLNTINTNEEYMAQGFTAEEVPLIREHDQLFNQHQLANDWNTLEENDRFWYLVKVLGL